MDAPAPLYVTSPPAEYAERRRLQMIEVGCSEEYAATAAAEIEARCIQVASSFEANMRLSGKGGPA